MSLAAIITELYNTDWLNMTQSDREKSIIHFESQISDSPELSNAHSSTLQFLTKSINDIITQYNLFSGVSNFEYHADDCSCHEHDDGALVDETIYSNYPDPTPEEIQTWRAFVEQKIQDVDTTEEITQTDPMEGILSQRDDFLREFAVQLKEQNRRSYTLAQIATTLLDNSLKNLEQLDKLEQMLIAYKRQIFETESPQVFKDLLTGNFSLRKETSNE